MKVREAKIINLDIKGSFFEMGTEVIDDMILDILSGVSFEFRGQEGSINKATLQFTKDFGRGFIANIMIEYLHYINEEE